MTNSKHLYLLKQQQINNVFFKDLFNLYECNITPETLVLNFGTNLLHLLDSYAEFV